MSAPRLSISIDRAFLEGSFVFPNPWMLATGRLDAAGAVLCSVRFGISPLNDRIYVDGLDVDEGHRRRGLASAILLALVDRNQVAGQRLPVTALSETHGARAFWDALRGGRAPGLKVTDDLRVGDMDGERRRWRVAMMTDG